MRPTRVRDKVTSGRDHGEVRLSIVIVSWNTRSLLEACLRSVFEHPPRDTAEVWVVDNGSSDGSPDMVTDRFPNVRLIENTDNRGFAAANCQAIERAAGELVLLLNSDTEVTRGAVQALVDAIDSDSSVGIVGARLIGEDGELQVSCSRAPTPCREFVHLFHLDDWLPGLTYPVRQLQGTHSRPVDVVQGAALLARCEVFDQVGCLDGGYFMYSEEVELCDRTRRAGWSVCWVPQAEVIHYGGASTSMLADEMFQALYASKCRFYRRNRGSGSALLFKLALCAAAVPRLLVNPIGLIHRQDNTAQTTRARRYWRLLRSLPSL